MKFIVAIDLYYLLKLFIAGFDLNMDRRRRVFVTVGTTSFDKLIQTVSDITTLQILRERQYTDIMMQIGRGQFEPVNTAQDFDMKVDYFRYKDSLADDIHHADLVISHAGAGSCMEVLAANKPLLVVINEDLMDNHQLELAQQLYNDGHVLYSKCCDLLMTLQQMDLTSLRPFPPGQPRKFADFLDQCMGFS